MMQTAMKPADANETSQQPGWTLATLWLHVSELVASNDRRYDQQFADQKQAIATALAQAEKAVQKAETAIKALEDKITVLTAANDRRYDQQFMDQKEAVSTALAQAERAVMKAESATEKRFDAVNEFRSTLSDQQRNLMPRAEVEVIVKSIQDKIAVLTSAKDHGAGIVQGLGYVVGVIGIVTAIVTFVITHH